MLRTKAWSHRSSVHRAFAVCGVVALAVGLTDCGGRTRYVVPDESGGGSGGLESGGSVAQAGSRPMPSTGGTRAVGSAGSSGGMARGGDGGSASASAPPDASIPGTSDTPRTIECSTDCSSVQTLLPTLFLDPCCSSANTCGVDGGFLRLLGVDLAGACLPKNQPGEPDLECSDSPDTTVPFGSVMLAVQGFKGCCRPNGTCGFLINDIDTSAGRFTSPDLGCVSSETLNVFSVACGAGGAGPGGAGGAP